MKKTTSLKPEMLSWLILPLLFIWLGVSYLLGISRQPAWQAHPTSSDQSQVLAAIDVQTASASATPLHWPGTGLVTFWFDDGWLSQYMVAAPILKENNLPGAISITTGLVGYDAYVSWGQVKRLRYDGWEITSHSRTHVCDSEKMNEANLKDEIIGSLRDFSAHGIAVSDYVVPCGVLTPDLVNVVKDNYVSLRTATGGLNPLPLETPYHILAYTIHDNVTLPEIKTWLEEASKNQSWLILMFHQLDDLGTEYSLKPEKFEAIVDMVQKSKLPVVLPSQVIQMLPEAK